MSPIQKNIRSWRLYDRSGQTSKPNINGIDSKVVLESLSHSRFAITFDLYQHVMTIMKEVHAIAIDYILKKEPQEA